MLFTVGAGLVLTTIAAFVYMRRKHAKDPSPGSKELPAPNKAQEEDITELAEETVLLQSHSDLQSTDLSQHTVNTDNTSDPQHKVEEIQPLHTSSPESAALKQEIQRLESELENEKSGREEAEARCRALQRDVNSQTLASKTAEEKYNKLLQRFNCVSSKLKVAEDRCRTLVEAINSQDSGDEMEHERKHPLHILDEEEDGYTEEEDMSDEEEDDQERLIHGHPSLFRPIAKPASNDQSIDLDFELSQDVMEALVASAVGDSQEDDDDVDSLSEMLADNMDDEDLKDLLKAGTNISGLNIDLIENEDAREIQEDLKPKRQVWDQTANRWRDSDTPERLTPELTDRERDNLINELKANLRNGLEKTLICHSEDIENVNPNSNDTEVEDFKSLKQKWEHKLATPGEENSETT